MTISEASSNIQNNEDVLITGISKSALRWFAASLSLILFTSIVGLSYSIGVDDAEKGSIPIIRADGQTIKIRPENPGGKQYPHQDLTIYNSFRDDIVKKDVQLKKNPEKPINLESALNVTDNKQDVESNNKIKENTEFVSDKVLPSDDIPLTTVSEDINIAKDNTPQIKKDTTKNILIKEQKVLLTLKKEKNLKQKISLESNNQDKKTKSNKGSFLQIGAFRSHADALSALKNARRKFPRLSKVDYVIIKANLGSKGTYYRLRVGPYKSKQTSLTNCSYLKTKGQACLYVLQ